MVFRGIFYYFLLFIVCEGIALTAVAWSFYESVHYSFQLLKHSSEIKARDTLWGLSKYAEAKMNPVGLEELNKQFNRIQETSKKDIDKNTIDELFILDTEGRVAVHSTPSDLKQPYSERPILEKYNKPFFMRALRMPKHQVPVIQEYGSEYSGNGDHVEAVLLKLFPDLKKQNFALSAPVYHPIKLVTLGSIHAVYSRENLGGFISKQKELLIWMGMQYAIIGLIASLFLELIYLVFVVFGRKSETIELKVNKVITLTNKTQDVQPSTQEVIVDPVKPVPTQEVIVDSVKPVPTPNEDSNQSNPKIMNVNLVSIAEKVSTYNGKAGVKEAIPLD